MLEFGGRNVIDPNERYEIAPDIAALTDIARAKGMSQVACDAGLSRESLCKALSGERNSTLDMGRLSRLFGERLEK